MVVAAAVCPCPPLLVPEVAQGAADELEPLRAACDEAVRALVEAKPDLIVVVGPGPRDAVHEPGATGSFRGYGVPLDVTLGEGATPADAAPLPLSLTVGAWLLARSGWTGPVRAVEAAEDGDPRTHRARGAEIARWADRVALLVTGDGSARRDVKAPGYLDDRAAPLDARIAAALASGDADGFLAELDRDTARALMVSGRPAWQVLTGAGARAGAGAGADAGAEAGAGTDTGALGHHRLLHDAAPYGVGYFVASWT